MFCEYMGVIKDIDVSLLDDPILALHPKPDINYLRELAQSIKETGQLHEIVVRPVGDRYQVVVGHCRTQAAKLFGIKTLRARVEELNEKDALLASATENIQRLEQDPLKEAELFAKLIEDYQMTEGEIAERFGKSSSYVQSRLSLLKLSPDVQAMLRRKEISLGVAVECSKITSHTDQLLVASSFREQPVTVERAKAIIKDFQHYKEEMKDKKPQEALELAKTEPMARCEICGNTVKLNDIKGIGICKTCYHGVIYLMEKERREKEKELSEAENKS